VKKRKREEKCHAVDEALHVRFKQVTSCKHTCKSQQSTEKENDFGKKLKDSKQLIDC
jgi:hypothetical protein